MGEDGIKMNFSPKNVEVIKCCLSFCTVLNNLDFFKLDWLFRAYHIRIFFILKGGGINQHLVLGLNNQSRPNGVIWG